MLAIPATLSAAVSDEGRKPYTVLPDGGLRLDFHQGQWDAWDAITRFIFILAGTQGGKTSFLPHWLHREIYGINGRGSGDYLAVTATFDLFKLKFLPTMRELFEGVTKDGRYWAGDRIIELRDPTPHSRINPRGGTFWARRANDPMWGRIILRSAEAGSGLESTTAKAAVLDECGMDHYTAETWKAVLRRCALNRARVLGATTLYVVWNWLRTIYEAVTKGERHDTTVVQFDSTINPDFPMEEFLLAEGETSQADFAMKYKGQYGRPSGLIYDVFNPETQIIKPFNTSPSTTFFEISGGMDYGGVNTVCLRVAYDEETRTYYVTDEYKRGGKTAAQHASFLSHWGAKQWRGGAPSEGQWRREFRQAGLNVAKPRVSDLWVGINSLYAIMKQNRLFVFDRCQGLIGELASYSRPMDPKTGEPIQDAIVNKSTYHHLDALRYDVATKKRRLQGL